MPSIKGLAERSRSTHNFSLETEDGTKLDFSLREPSGVEETVSFVNDFRKTSKQINSQVTKIQNIDDLSIEDRLDIIDGLFEIKFKFCVKWLQALSVDEVSEDDCIKAYELVGKVNTDEESSLFYQIVKACGLLGGSISVGDDDDTEDEENQKDFTI